MILAACSFIQFLQFKFICPYEVTMAESDMKAWDRCREKVPNPQKLGLKLMTRIFFLQPRQSAGDRGNSGSEKNGFFFSESWLKPPKWKSLGGGTLVS